MIRPVRSLPALRTQRAFFWAFHLQLLATPGLARISHTDE